VTSRPWPRQASTSSSARAFEIVSTFGSSMTEISGAAGSASSENLRTYFPRMNVSAIPPVDQPWYSWFSL
jgi:hypothetical protein